MRTTLITVFLAAISSAACLSSAMAADHYSASSNTAMSITGDVDIDDAGITFENGKELTFSDLIADSLVVDGKRVPGSVYRVAQPFDPELKNGNRLCGTGKVTYLATWSDGDGSTAIAVFTGSRPPRSDDESCATYSYQDQE
ncbi:MULTISPECIES: hypothetical protein [Rhizobium]|uniref:Lipoprotein n=1 Tax=Rhizobium paranaense TaxID=1650438 RepID=A0A7W8XZ82_9HYPH|nr:hypothetical protein [Rhizobium paranaense]MBB5578064.1 hypothetical protein [Rhizobium paranaense]